MIETYMLEHIVAFSKEGTLSAAAEKLFISQPALTRSMQKLEKIIGVKLFDRAKNRISLNDNGKMTAEFAENILKEYSIMIDSVRAFERNKHTISIGSCAPFPLNNVFAILTQVYENKAITTELVNDKELWEGFKNGIYNIIIMHSKPTDIKLFSKKCGSEKLFFSLPKKHPLAKKKALYLKDMDGATMLLYSKIGFWYDLCKREMPKARFLLQNNRETFNELTASQAFPFFTTDLVMKTRSKLSTHNVISILDKEANTTYYAVCKKEDKEKFDDFFKVL